jgi:hypothetical protein
MDEAKPMARAKAWVGVDVGKNFHWAVVVDAEGEILLSRRVDNEEADLSALVEEVLAISSGKLCAGRSTSPEAARRCCWRSFGDAVRESCTSRASRWTAPETASGARPRPTAQTPSSSPSKRA